MREQGGDVRHGRALPDRAGRDGGRVLRRGPPGHASARRHRPGTLGGEKGGGDGYTRSGGKSLLLPPARGQQPGILAVLFLFPVPSRARLFPSLSLRRGGQHKSFAFFFSPCSACLFSCFAKWRNEQAALPQGIVPFVFAKEYNVHPDILSTA